MHDTGLRSQGSGAEAAWVRALTADPGDPAEAGGGGSPTWPILAFLAFVLGAPWLLWRIFSAASKRAGGCGEVRVTNARDKILQLCDVKLACNNDLSLCG